MSIKKPDIFLVMADELRADFLDSYGDSQFNTPHLDALSGMSTVYFRHYSPIPLCIPARTSLFTSTYPQRNGAIVNGWESSQESYREFGPQHITLHELLDQAGYQVYHIGVRHLFPRPSFKERVPSAQFISEPDFNNYLSHHNKEPFNDTSYRRPCPDFADGKLIERMYIGTQIGIYPYGSDDFYDMFLVREACRVIREAHPEQPLAIFLTFWAPHPPLVAPREYLEMYDPAKIKLSPNVGVRGEGQATNQLIDSSGFFGVQLLREEWKACWAAYGGLVSLLDDAVGMFLSSLKEVGRFKDSLIIFSSDHGEFLGSHGLWQKMALYEESLRVPLFIKYPTQKIRRICNELTNHLDIMPTILKEAKITVPLELQGFSLQDLENTKSNLKEYVVCSYNGNGGRGIYRRAIITKQWKYIYNYLDKSELYQLVSDPYELSNLSGCSEYKAKEDELKLLLQKWMKLSGDFLSL